MYVIIGLMQADMREGTLTTIADPEMSKLGPIYLQAAAKITEQGYAAFDDYEGETGISITTALRLAAEDHFDATVNAGGPPTSMEWNLADVLETRLGAVLYLTGLVTSGNTGDLAGVPSAWERRYYGGTDGRAGGPGVDQIQAVALLQTAAALISTITGA